MRDLKSRKTKNLPLLAVSLVALLSMSLVTSCAPLGYALKTGEFNIDFEPEAFANDIHKDDRYTIGEIEELNIGDEKLISGFCEGKATGRIEELVSSNLGEGGDVVRVYCDAEKLSEGSERAYILQADNEKAEYLDLNKMKELIYDIFSEKVHLVAYDLKNDIAYFEDNGSFSESTKLYRFPHAKSNPSSGENLRMVELDENKDGLLMDYALSQDGTLYIISSKSRIFKLAPTSSSKIQLVSSGRSAKHGQQRIFVRGDELYAFMLEVPYASDFSVDDDDVQNYLMENDASYLWSKLSLKDPYTLLTEDGDFQALLGSKKEVASQVLDIAPNKEGFRIAYVLRRSKDAARELRVSDFVPEGANLKERQLASVPLSEDYADKNLRINDLLYSDENKSLALSLTASRFEEKKEGENVKYNSEHQDDYVVIINAEDPSRFEAYNVAYGAQVSRSEFDQSGGTKFSSVMLDNCGSYLSFYRIAGRDYISSYTLNDSKRESVYEYRPVSVASLSAKVDEEVTSGSGTTVDSGSMSVEKVKKKESRSKILFVVGIFAIAVLIVGLLVLVIIRNNKKKKEEMGDDDAKKIVPMMGEASPAPTETTTPEITEAIAPETTETTTTETTETIVPEIAIPKAVGAMGVTEPAKALGEEPKPETDPNSVDNKNLGQE